MKKPTIRSAFSIQLKLNYFAGAASAAGADAGAAASAAGAVASAAGAAGAAGASAAGADAAGGVTTSTAGASSFLLQAVKAIANRDAISRVFVMIVFQ